VTVTSVACVVTANGGRYLRQLCKHWSHQFEVEVEAGRGRIMLPAETVATLEDHGDSLEVQLVARDVETLARMQGVLKTHLERFASRETTFAVEGWSDCERIV
jgi:uncharacterized protein